jgi:hypothetical protein
LGINAVFVHSSALDSATIQRARKENCRVFTEFATLNGAYGNYVEKHPEAHPIEANGEKVAKATWFMGACPTDPGFRSYRMNALRVFLNEHAVDGVWMDYLHWHAQFEDPYPLFLKPVLTGPVWLPSKRPPMSKFKGKARRTKPSGSCSIERESGRIGAFRYWSTGRANFILSSRRFGPRPYHGRSDMPTTYVKEYVEYFSQRHTVHTEAGRYPRLWPIVQAHDEPRVSPEEFAEVLEYALAAKSSGAMMFTSASIAADPEKLAAVRRVYTRQR